MNISFVYLLSLLFFSSDIDECTLNSDDCDDTLGTCINNDGSWDCECNTGYEGDGTTSGSGCSGECNNGFGRFRVRSLSKTDITMELSQCVTTMTVPGTVNVTWVMKGIEPLLGQDAVVSVITGLVGSGF